MTCDVAFEHQAGTQTSAVFEAGHLLSVSSSVQTPPLPSLLPLPAPAYLENHIQPSNGPGSPREALPLQTRHTRAPGRLHKNIHHSVVYGTRNWR